MKPLKRHASEAFQNVLPACCEPRSGTMSCGILQILFASVSTLSQVAFRDFWEGITRANTYTETCYVIYINISTKQIIKISDTEFKLFFFQVTFPDASFANRSLTSSSIISFWESSITDCLTYAQRIQFR